MIRRRAIAHWARAAFAGAAAGQRRARAARCDDRQRSRRGKRRAPAKQRRGDGQRAARREVGGRTRRARSQARASVAPDDTVFIWRARSEGPRMPLAVMRIKARELPRDVQARRRDGDVAGAERCPSAARVVVEARVSKSGNAKPQTGDLRGTSAPVKPGARDVRIVIGEVLP